jgi:hypothetical protein
MIKYRRDTPNSSEMLIGVGEVRLRVFMSYDTIVGVKFFTARGGEVRQRIESPSRTTTKHLKDCGMWTYADVVTREALDQTIRRALVEIGLGLIGPQWAESATQTA